MSNIVCDNVILSVSLIDGHGDEIKIRNHVGEMVGYIDVQVPSFISVKEVETKLKNIISALNPDLAPSIKQCWLLTREHDGFIFEKDGIILNAKHKYKYNNLNTKKTVIEQGLFDGFSVCFVIKKEESK